MRSTFVPTPTSSQLVTINAPVSERWLALETTLHTPRRSAAAPGPAAASPVGANVSPVGTTVSPVGTPTLPAPPSPLRVLYPLPERERAVVGTSAVGELELLNALSLVNVPTLLLHGVGARVAPVSHAHVAFNALQCSSPESQLVL